MRVPILCKSWCVSCINYQHNETYGDVASTTIDGRDAILVTPTSLVPWSRDSFYTSQLLACPTFYFRKSMLFTAKFK